ncbi:MAG: hypothetical protein R3194_02530 [Limnobacter sp.]|nr:hypothetical protein [Limnobacter sp.]
MSHTIELTRHQAAEKLADCSISSIIEIAKSMALEHDQKTSTCVRTLLSMIHLELYEERQKGESPGKY